MNKPPPLRLLSVVIPAQDEEGCIASTVSHLQVQLSLHGVEHEIVVVVDGRTDRTWSILEELRKKIQQLSPADSLILLASGSSF
jgi:dolichol-phosphate mannosyltransferase